MESRRLGPAHLRSRLHLPAVSSLAKGVPGDEGELCSIASPRNPGGVSETSFMPSDRSVLARGRATEGGCRRRSSSACRRRVLGRQAARRCGSRRRGHSLVLHSRAATLQQRRRSVPNLGRFRGAARSRFGRKQPNGGCSARLGERHCPGRSTCGGSAPFVQERSARSLAGLCASSTRSFTTRPRWSAIRASGGPRRPRVSSE